MSALAGWYPDPESPHVLRWYDGTRWTEHRRLFPEDHTGEGIDEDAAGTPGAAADGAGSTTAGPDGGSALDHTPPDRADQDQADQDRATPGLGTLEADRELPRSGALAGERPTGPHRPAPSQDVPAPVAANRTGEADPPPAVDTDPWAGTRTIMARWAAATRRPEAPAPKPTEGVAGSVGEVAERLRRDLEERLRAGGTSTPRRASTSDQGPGAARATTSTHEEPSASSEQPDHAVQSPGPAAPVPEVRHAGGWGAGGLDSEGLETDPVEDGAAGFGSVEASGAAATPPGPSATAPPVDRGATPSASAVGPEVSAPADDAASTPNADEAGRSGAPGLEPKPGEGSSTGSPHRHGDPSSGTSSWVAAPPPSPPQDPEDPTPVDLASPRGASAGGPAPLWLSPHHEGDAPAAGSTASGRHPAEPPTGLVPGPGSAPGGAEAPVVAPAPTASSHSPRTSAVPASAPPDHRPAGSDGPTDAPRATAVHLGAGPAPRASTDRRSGTAAASDGPAPAASTPAATATTPSATVPTSEVVSPGDVRSRRGRRGRRGPVAVAIAVLVACTVALIAITVLDRGPAALGLRWQGRAIEDPGQVLARAEALMGDVVARGHGAVAPDTRCYFSVPADATGTAEVEPAAVCGPVQFAGGTTQRAYLRFGLTAAPGTDPVELRVGPRPLDPEPVAPPAGRQLVRPDGRTPPTEVDLAAPAAPAAAPFTVAVADLPPGGLAPLPAGSVIGSWSGRYELVGAATVDQYRSEGRLFTAPAGYEIHALRLVVAAGESGATPGPAPEVLALEGGGARWPVPAGVHEEGEHVVVAVVPAGTAIDLVVGDLGVEQRRSTSDGAPGEGNLAVLARAHRHHTTPASLSMSVAHEGPAGAGTANGSLVIEGTSLRWWAPRDPAVRASAPDRALLVVNAAIGWEGLVPAGRPLGAGALRLDLPDGTSAPGTDLGSSDGRMSMAFEVPADFTVGTLVVGGVDEQPDGTTLRFGEVELALPLQVAAG